MITDDDIATVVVAVREGRAIYDNIRKVVDYLVAGNLSEIAVVVAALFLLSELGIPLLPLQLLWINLLTDALPAVALGLDPVDPGLMRRGPRRVDSQLLDRSRIARLTLRGAVLAGVTLSTGVWVSHAWGRPAPVVRTIVFTTLVLAHLAYAYVARRPEGSPGSAASSALLTSNTTLAVACVGGAVLQAVVVAWPAAQEVFGTVGLTVSEWSLTVVAAAAATALIAGVVGIERRGGRPNIESLTTGGAGRTARPLRGDGP